MPQLESFVVDTSNDGCSIEARVRYAGPFASDTVYTCRLDIWGDDGGGGKNDVLMQLFAVVPPDDPVVRFGVFLAKAAFHEDRFTKDEIYGRVLIWGQTTAEWSSEGGGVIQIPKGEHKAPETLSQRVAAKRRLPLPRM